MDTPSGQYRLCGVVHHVGNTAFSGHYTTCAKRKMKPSEERLMVDDNINKSSDNPQNVDEQWVFFDDRVGHKKNLDYVTDTEKNQRNCYMALYELK